MKGQGQETSHNLYQHIIKCKLIVVKWNYQAAEVKSNCSEVTR